MKSHELCAELQTVGRQMQILVDGLDLTRARLRTALGLLAPTASTCCNWPAPQLELDGAATGSSPR